MKQALKIMEHQHVCKLASQFSVTRNKQKLESLYTIIQKKSSGEKRQSVHILTLNPDSAQIPVSAELAYIAAHNLDQKILWIDTTEKSEILKTITDQRAGVTPSIPQGSLAIFEVKGSSLYLMSLPKRQGEKATTEQVIKETIDSLQSNFDLVIIDGNSPIVRPENLNFSSCADGVVLVLEAEKSRIPVINEVKQKLETRGIEIIGTVLNNRRLYIPDFIYKRLFKS